MILPMRKLSLLIFHKDYQGFLGELRERGVVHIHENKQRSAEDEKLKQRLVLLKRVGEMIKRLSKQMPGEEGLKQSAVENGEELLQALETSFKRIDQIGQQIAVLEKDEAVYNPWGIFPKEQITGLQRAGWDLRFFTVPDRKYLPEWETEQNTFIINQEKGQTYFITVAPAGENTDLEADKIVFPSMTVEEIKVQKEKLEEEKNGVNLYLRKVAEDATERLKIFRNQVLEDTDVLQVNNASSVLVDEKVIALEGWIPENIATETGQWLDGKDVFYELSEPSVEDNPPILLKNNKFARLFEFIGELYSMPNYREIDMTPFFAPFFVLFFGFCLGDAGYGLLIFLGVTIYKIKAKPAIRPILSLAQWLGAATVVMGIVSGTFFGIQLLEVQVPWLVKFRSIMLDSQQLFNLALAIGGVQIIFGMCLKVINQWKQGGFAAALSTIGWLVLILGEGSCYLLSEKGYDVKIPMYTIAAIGGLLIFVFNNVRRNVFINVGAGLWDSYNMVTGLLGDTLSYIRLFALGISSSVLGLVFNDLAINMSGDIPVVKQLIMLIILVFGHSVNLFMAGLGSFVHPMRLTFVEFYKNAGFEGGGKKYQPFKKRN